MSKGQVLRCDGEIGVGFRVVQGSLGQGDFLSIHNKMPI